MIVLWDSGGATLTCGWQNNNSEKDVLKHKANSTLKHHVFSILSSGSFYTLFPNAPENNPSVFFPQLAGNDLTIARKRNVKHSLELLVTSEERGGPCAPPQPGNSRARWTPTPNSWSQLLPRSHSKTISDTHASLFSTLCVKHYTAHLGLRVILYKG